MLMGSELGNKCMAWLVVREEGKVEGVWNRDAKWVSNLVISRYWVVSKVSEGLSESRIQIWKKALALSVCTIRCS